MSKPNREPAKIGEVDVELFAHNLARLIEEGGKALSAYLKPREEGKVDDGISHQVTEAIIKSLGGVAEYWLADPKRAVEMQASLGRAYLDLWASAVKRMTGEP
ncbi:MAG: class I poly(R)-hydroxyalkanoic acid synthase, partial [Pseudolabrys sp.]